MLFVKFFIINPKKLLNLYARLQDTLGIYKKCVGVAVLYEI
jgi:hypothetical protein